MIRPSLYLIMYNELNNLLIQSDVMCHYLTVRCLLEAKEHNDALQVINESEIYTNITQAGITFADRTDIFQDAPKNVRVYSYMCVCVCVYTDMCICNNMCTLICIMSS